MKKNSSTGKSNATPKPKQPNPLDSANWISESSVQHASLRAADPLPSPSNDPCKDCHVDFFEEEVTVQWAEAPDNTYQASENVNTSSGGWMPDLWSLFPTSSGASIDEDSGEVTFGSEGCSVTITAGVKRCRLCRKSFKANIAQLQILRKGGNVTDKTTDAFAGETVPLKAKVLPANLKGTDWQWNAQGNLVKDFVVSPDKHTGKRINYAAADFQKPEVSLHWVDGKPEGEDKTVTLVATVKGMPVTAKTTVKVTRPARLFTVSFSKTGIYHFATPPGVGATTHAEFKRDQIQAGGTAQWIQLGVLNKRIFNQNGTDFVELEPKPDDEGVQHPGLDKCAYPYDTKKDTTDNPRTDFAPLYLTDTFTFNLKMWLMWKPPNSKPGIWIPLASARWLFQGTMAAAPDPLNPIWAPLPPPLINPLTTSSAAVVELEYPQWTQCLLA